MKRKIKVGEKYGRLITIEKIKSAKGVKSRWLCVCDCGRSKSVIGSDLLGGKVKSCGCLLKEAKGRPTNENAKNRHPLYATWNNMMSRCYNHNSTSYKRYGALGITVCDRWHTFELFVEDIGERPSKLHSVDRIKNNLGYFKENCRWATDKEQARNRISNKLLMVDGVVKPLCEWSELSGISADVINKRFDKHGWSAYDSVFSPITPYGRKGVDNPKCKLTDLDVIEILESNEKQKILADRYMVSVPTIQRIKSRMSWKHLIG